MTSESEWPPRRVFVDCDDTLIHWLTPEGEVLPGPNPYGGTSTRWRVNWELFERLQALYAMGTRMVIWTGGGAQYAERWNIALNANWGARDKDPSVPRRGDLVIDDAYLWDSPAEVQTAEQFIGRTEWPSSIEARG